MKLALNLLNFGQAASLDNFQQWVAFAEKHAFDALLISDHLAITPDVAARYPTPFFDPFVLLAWAAAKTTTLELGTTVTIVPYRHPLHTARLVANLDQLSNGRFIFGVGVGWAQQEFTALGADFEHRGSVANEYLEVMRLCWTQDVVSFSGQFVSFSDVHTGPRPVRQPYPPIWVGGTSDAAVRRAVRYGTAWHPIRSRLSWLRDVGYPQLKSIAKAESKPVPELSPRIMVQVLPSAADDGERVMGQGTVQQIMGDLRALFEMGATYVTLDSYTHSGNALELRDLEHHFDALSTVVLAWRALNLK